MQSPECQLCDGVPLRHAGGTTWQCPTCGDRMVLLACSDCDGSGKAQIVEGERVVGHEDCPSCEGSGWLCPDGHSLYACACFFSD